MNENLELRQLYPDLFTFLATKSSINPQITFQNGNGPIDEYEELNALDNINKSINKSALSLKNSKYNTSMI